MRFDMRSRKTEHSIRLLGYSLLPLCFVGILAAGCAATRSPTTVAFEPTGKGPLSSIKPFTVLVRVEDQRPPAEQDSVFQIIVDIGGNEIWYTNKPVPLIVQDALISELSKCGHRAVTDTSAKVDARVKVLLKRFRAFCSVVGGFSFSVEAEVDAEVVVTNDARKATTPPFQISGNYQRVVGGVKGPDKELSEALAEFIHNLTFDSRLVEGLK
jgi:hypothetical protein